MDNVKSRTLVGENGVDGEIVQYLQKEIESLSLKNLELTKQNSDLKKKAESLEFALRANNKGAPLSVSMPKQRPILSFHTTLPLNFSCIRTSSPTKNPAEELKVAPPSAPSIFPPIPIPAARKDPPPMKILEPSNMSLCKDCILSSGGKLYEDDELQIAVVRSIDAPSKTATLKLNFFNKTLDQYLIINQFASVSCNKAGTISSLLRNDSTHYYPDHGFSNQSAAGRADRWRSESYAEEVYDREHSISDRI